MGRDPRCGEGVRFPDRTQFFMGGVIMGATKVEIGEDGFHLVEFAGSVVLVFGEWDLLRLMPRGGKVQLAAAIKTKKFKTDERGCLLIDDVTF